MKELSSPPSEPVAWKGVMRLSGEYRFVMDRTWYGARAKLATLFRCDPGDVLVSPA